jgi:hypothetical protein
VVRSRRDSIRLGAQRIVEAQKEAKEKFGVDLDKQQAVDYITKRDYGVKLGEGGDPVTFTRAGDGVELQVQNLGPQSTVLKKGRRGPILEGNEDEDYAMGGSEDQFREFILTPLEKDRFSSPGASTPRVRKPDSFQEDNNLLQQQVQREVIELGEEVKQLKKLAMRGGESGTRAEAMQLYALAKKKEAIIAAARRDGIYNYDEELGSYEREQFARSVQSKESLQYKDPMQIIYERQEPGRRLASRSTRLSKSEVEAAVRSELNKRFTGNDTPGSPIRSMPIGAYKDAEQEIRAALLARNNMDSPAEKIMRQSNYADAMLEARLLMNNAGYAPEIRTTLGRPDYPDITPEALGEYNAVERPPLKELEELKNEKSFMKFVNDATMRMEGESPAVASGDILDELRRRAIQKLPAEDVLKLPLTLSGPKAVKEVLEARLRQDRINNIKYKVFGEGGFKGEVPAGQASLVDLISALGYKGPERDQLGYALGQLAAGQARGLKAMKASDIGAVPMGSKLGRSDNFGFMIADKGPLGVRGVTGSAEKAIPRESLKKKLERLDDTKAPGASKQTMAINVEDYPNKNLTGKEGMIFNDTGESMPIRIKMAIDQKGYGRDNVEKAINAQLRADAAQKKIEDQIRLRNQYMPPSMRQPVGESGTTDVISRYFGPEVAVNDDLISYPENY